MIRATMGARKFTIAYSSASARLCWLGSDSCSLRDWIDSSGEQQPSRPYSSNTVSFIADEAPFLGGSSAVNLAGALRLAEKPGPGRTIVSCRRP